MKDTIKQYLFFEDQNIIEDISNNIKKIYSFDFDKSRSQIHKNKKELIANILICLYLKMESYKVYLMDQTLYKLKESGKFELCDIYAEKNKDVFLIHAKRNDERKVLEQLERSFLIRTQSISNSGKLEKNKKSYNSNVYFNILEEMGIIKIKNGTTFSVNDIEEILLNNENKSNHVEAMLLKRNIKNVVLFYKNFVLDGVFLKMNDVKNLCDQKNEKFICTNLNL